MATTITEQTRTEISQLYVALFGRAPDDGGLEYWGNLRQTGTSLVTIADTMFATEPARAYYPAGQSNQDIIASFYLNVLGRPADAEGLAFWTNKLNTPGATNGSVILEMINVVTHYTGNHVDGLFSAALFANKVAVASWYAENIGGIDNADDILSGVTSDRATVDAIINSGNTGVGNVFTLKEVVVPATAGTPAVTAVYWGYNPHAHGETNVDNTAGGNTNNQTNEGPVDGGIPVQELIAFLTTITGLDFAELGLIDANGVDPFQNVTSLTLSNPLSPNNSNSGDATGSGNTIDQGTQLTIHFADGTFLNAEVALGDQYFTFLNNLLFDAEGNSRLFEKTIVEAGSGVSEHLKPIVLTLTQNNGGTHESGVTTINDDLIVAGRLELLHQAYIDAGPGYNVLEIDAKGTYAQPLLLKNIQEIRVNDLPNFYTTGYHTADGYLENTLFNDPAYLIPDPDGTGSDNSWIDLNRAINLSKLVVTDQGTSPDGGSGISENDGYSGNLTIVGVRNAATLRLEHGFNSGSTTIQYGQGQTGVLNIELVGLGDVQAPINILQNAAVLNIDSQGVVNHMHQFFAGGSVSRMYVEGAGVFAVDQDLSQSFNSAHPVIIDASANTGGLDVTLNGHYDISITGTQANDEITAENSGIVNVVAGNGTNVIDVDGSDYVTITSGTGNDTITARNGVEVTIDAGPGRNNITTDGSQFVDITTGAGNDTISSTNGESVTIAAGDGNNVIVTNNAWSFNDSTHYGTSIINITTGVGNDTISATRAGTVTIDAGNGTNKITVSAHEININTGTGNDTVSLSGMNITFDQGDQGEPGSGFNQSAGFNGWNDDNYTDEVHFVDTFAPGALLNLALGAGNNTINLGRDVTDLDNSSDVDVQYGITALEGSVISGTGIRLFVENNSDLTKADLTGATISSVVLKQELRITAEQFDAIGAPAFSVLFDEEGATEDLYLVVTSSTTLDDLLDGQALAPSVRLHFEIHNGATLTLSAEQLHKLVAWHGIDSTDGLNGKVVITNAGPTFDAFDNGNDYQVIDGGSLTDSFSASDDVTVLRSTTGFNRPEPLVSTDTTTIDSTGVAPLVITDPIIIDGGNPTTLKLIGNQDIVFQAPVDLGDGGDRGDRIDFSDLVGNVIGLTVKNFDNIKSVAGNSTDTRINVELTGNVGTAAQGLVSSGVEQYVVTAVQDNDNDDLDGQTTTATFYLCDQTLDVEVIGIKGLAGKTVTFSEVPWGLVHPSILLEGDGYADWNGGLKADGNPDASDIGNVVVNYFTAGAPAVVNINNGGVNLGVTSTGAERGFAVGTITLNNAQSLSLNVTEGDAVIADINGSALTTLTITATEDVTVTDTLPASLTAINASGVVGHLDVSFDPTDDFTFVGAAGGSTLQLIGNFTATSDTSISGGSITLVIDAGDNIDLADANLSNITTVQLEQGATLHLTLDQADLIGAANIVLAEGATAANLHLEGLAGQPFALANYADGISVLVVDIAALPVVTLNPATDLTGITTLAVHEGTVLNLTAAQYQQLTGAGAIISADIPASTNFTVNITDLTQASVDSTDPLEDGFDLSGITAANLTVTLAENVALETGDNLFGATTGADINIGDNLKLTVADIQDTDGLTITGGVNSTLEFADLVSGAFESTDASGYNVTYLRIPNVLVADRNIDLLFSGLPQAVTKVIYNDLGFVEGVTQTVVLEAGTTVPGFTVFNLPADDVEIRHFILNVQGGTEIDGNLRLSSSVKDSSLIPTHLQTVVINSTGTAANLLTGDTANIISGKLTSQGTGNQPSTPPYTSVDNNLLDITINGNQALEIQGGVVFSSVTGDDGISANDNDAAIASVVVNSSANTYIGAVNTTDNDVDGLNVVNNGTGVLTVKLDGDKLDQVINVGPNDFDTGDNINGNNDALSFTGTGAINLIIDPTVDLSDDILTAVTQIKIEDNGTLILTQAQIEAIGIANLLDDGENTLDGATLHIEEFGSNLFDATLLDPGINLGTITTQAGSVTLNPATNITGADEIVVPEGSTLTLTAAQFQQLVGKGKISGLDNNGNTGDGDPFTLNITGLTQADINAGFDLSDVADGATITLSLAENVNFDANTQLRETAGTGNLHNLTVILADGQVLGLHNSLQADGLDINGGVGSTVVFRFSALVGGDLVADSDGNFGTILADGYNVDFLRALDQFVGGINVEDIIDDLPSATTLVVVNTPAELGIIDQTNRVVIVEPGVTVPAVISFSDVGSGPNGNGEELRTLSLELQGGTKINGGIKLFTEAENGPPAPPASVKYFASLFIESNGTAVNIADGVTTDNVITGNITAADDDGAGAHLENNLLQVSIDATQNLVIHQAGPGVGNIVFTSVDASVFPTATLNISGTANVTVDQLDVSDAQISTFIVNNTGTGLLTVTGGSPAIIGGPGLETIDLNGTGDIVLGDNDAISTDETGVSGANLSLIDASGLSGDLNLGQIIDVDGTDFTLLSGTGVTIARLSDDTLNSTNGTPGNLTDDTAGWTINYSAAAAGSQFHLGGGTVPLTLVDESKLTINMGPNGVLYIDESLDLSDLDLSILQTQPIVLADGAVLTLTAAQADGLTIIAGADTGLPGFTGVVNIVDLGDAPVDLSGIALGVAGTVSLVDNDVTLDVATDLGAFTVYLRDLGPDGSLNGQTIRYTTVAQADNKVLVGSALENSDGNAEFFGIDSNPGSANHTDNDSSTNVVWLFENIAAPVDTSGYDGELSRLWLNDTLIANEGGDVENLFTTLPSTILRVDFGDIVALNILLNSNAVDRVIEFTNFVTLGNLTFNDMGVSPVEHIRNLDMRLGGEVTLGDVVIDDIIGAPGYDPNSVEFQTLTIRSYRALHQDDLLASEGYVNDNDGTAEVGEHALPDNINTIGDINVGGANNIDLTAIVIHTNSNGVAAEAAGDVNPDPGAAIQIGTVTYDSEVAGDIVTLVVDGSNNINITSVDTSDADIVAINTTNSLAGGATLVAPGASPAFNLDNTEAWTVAGAGNMSLGSATNAGVVGNDLSHIDASGSSGNLAFGVVADIDGNDDLAEDNNGDGDTTDLPLYEAANIAFDFRAGSGINTMTLGTANGRTPQLDTGSTWSFNYLLAAAGSSLTITDDVIFQAGAILQLVDVPVVINGNVDLTQVVLNFDATTTVFVAAGNSLKLTIDQVQALDTLGVVISGEGTTIIVGDGTDDDLSSLVTLQTVGVDISAVTLDTTLPLPQDLDGVFQLTVGGALNDLAVAVGQNVIGSANDDVITTGENDDTITGGLGNDVYDAGGGNDTFIADAGNDSTVYLNEHPSNPDQDVVKVSAGASFDGELFSTAGNDSFVATADTSNSGTGTIRTDVGTAGNTLIDMSLATGPNGWTLIGSTEDASSIDTLIGSNQGDVINGGNLHQTAAAAADVLTGNGGGDIFEFNLDLGVAATMDKVTVTAGVDREIITITADAVDNDNESLTVNYTINGIADAVLVDFSGAGLFDVTDANAIAAAVASALNAKADIGATSTGAVVTVSGDNGGNLTLGAITAGGTAVELAGLAANGTDDAQVMTVTINGTPNTGDFYSLIADYASPLTGEASDYTALAGDTAAVVAAGLEGNYTDGEVVATVATNVLTLTDGNGDNGGFALTTDTTAAFAGSGASDNGAINYLTADVITDFLSGTDKIDFNLQVGSGANYLEALEVADYATARADAVTAFTTNAGSLQYYLTSATDLDGAVGTGLVQGNEGAATLFFDANLDGNVDGVVLLTGVTQASFSAFDIIA